MGRVGLFGTTRFFFGQPGGPWLMSFFLFQTMFCGTVATIISGVVAERIRFAVRLEDAADERIIGSEGRMKRILVVEDIELNRDLLVQLLEDDYEVVTANDGAAGIAAAEELRPDVILMDLSLPVIDGWEATRRIKANRELKTIPVIAVTAHAMQGDAEKARAAGCDDYLTKPVDEDLLLATLRNLLE